MKLEIPIGKAWLMLCRLFRVLCLKSRSCFDDTFRVNEPGCFTIASIEGRDLSSA